MANVTYCIPVLNTHVRELENNDEADDVLSASGRCCAWCCGYCTPFVLAALVVALGMSALVYYIWVMALYPDAWRVVVLLILCLVTAPLTSIVLWAYYQVIFTSPGFVLQEPWRHLPKHALIMAREARGEQQLQASQENQQRMITPVNPSSAPNVGAACSHNLTTTLSALTTSGDGTLVSTGQEGAAISSGETSPLNPYIVQDVDMQGHYRYCIQCKIFKPDNAYHCGLCKRCIYNFDHHCPFINNCVGRNNYKLFVLFLMYGGIAGTTVGLLMLLAFFVIDKRSFTSNFGWLVPPSIMLILGLSLILFWAQHESLIRKGHSTVVEMIEMKQSGGENMCLRGPKLSEEAHQMRKAAERERIEKRNCLLFGEKQTWWQRLLPIPVVTGNEPCDIPHV